ncbi:MAG: 50S ribosomal protein L11 methyltransferase [Leptospirillia bacterium]
MSPSTYTYASFHCFSEDLDGLLHWLNDHSPSSVLIEEGSPCRLVFVPPDPASAEWLLMESALISLGASAIEIRSARQEDWQEIWKEQGFKSFTVRDRLRVVPSWEDPEVLTPPDVIRIDPQMAFGTGLHETTYRCLELIVETADQWTGESPLILDFGSGTGILGVAALNLMKEATLISIDNDPYAMEATRHNLQANKMDDRSHVYRSFEEISPTSPLPSFDMILANVTGGILCTTSPTLYERLSPTGRMICSGVSKEETDGVARVLSGLSARVRHVPGERYDTYVLDKGGRPS